MQDLNTNDKNGDSCMNEDLAVDGKTENYNFEPYFLKSQDWADFWQKSQGDLIKNFELFGERIYEFKYKMNSKFWYIPHLGQHLKIRESLSEKDGENNTQKDNKTNFKNQKQGIKNNLEEGLKAAKIDENYLQKFKIEARQNKIDFITAEFSDTVKVEEKLIKNLPHAIRKTQYNSTILVDCRGLKSSKNDLKNISYNDLKGNSKTSENIAEFVKNNPEMLANFASSFRRKVKKSLKENWRTSTEKTKENLENFWHVYTETSKRQNFGIHPKKYYEKLFNLKNSRIIILFDEAGKVCGGWLGWKSEKNLTYLYGGNNDKALEKLGQYIIQLTAIQICEEENLDFYDLGGYEKDAGYGRFKEGFHGILREFPGPFDIVINPVKYNLLKTAGKIKDLLRKQKS